MGIVMTPDLWGLVVAAACLCGWMMGGAHGAAQARLDDQLEETRTAERLFSLRIPPKIATSRRTRQHAFSVEPLDGERSGLAAHAQRDEDDLWTRAIAERAEFRRRVFAEMPPICQVRAQARSIVQSDNVWDELDLSLQLTEFLQNADPASLEMLRHYQDSIEQLHEANDRGCNDDAKPCDMTEVAAIAVSGDLPVEYSLRVKDESVAAAPRPRYSSLGMR